MRWVLSVFIQIDVFLTNTSEIPSNSQDVFLHPATFFVFFGEKHAVFFSAANCEMLSSIHALRCLLMLGNEVTVYMWAAWAEAMWAMSWAIKLSVLAMVAVFFSNIFHHSPVFFGEKPINSYGIPIYVVIKDVAVGIWISSASSDHHFEETDFSIMISDGRWRPPTLRVHKIFVFIHILSWRNQTSSQNWNNNWKNHNYNVVWEYIDKSKNGFQPFTQTVFFSIICCMCFESRWISVGIFWSPSSPAFRTNAFPRPMRPCGWAIGHALMARQFVRSASAVWIYRS